MSANDVNSAQSDDWSLPAFPLRVTVQDLGDELFRCVYFFDLDIEMPAQLKKHAVWMAGIRLRDDNGKLVAKCDAVLKPKDLAGERLTISGSAIQDTEEPATAAELGLVHEQPVDLQVELEFSACDQPQETGAGAIDPKVIINPFGKMRPVPNGSGGYRWGLSSDDPESPRTQHFNLAGFYSYTLNNLVHSVPGLSWAAPSGVLYFSLADLTSGKTLHSCGPTAEDDGDCNDAEYDDVTWSYLGTGPEAQTNCVVNCNFEKLSLKPHAEGLSTVNLGQQQASRSNERNSALLIPGGHAFIQLLLRREPLPVSVEALYKEYPHPGLDELVGGEENLAELVLSAEAATEVVVKRLVQGLVEGVDVCRQLGLGLLRVRTSYVKPLLGFLRRLSERAPFSHWVEGVEEVQYGWVTDQHEAAPEKSDPDWPYQSLGRAAAWQKWGKGDPKLIVAVLDTGVNSKHAELHENTIQSKNLPNALLDLASSSQAPIDRHGHGTQVAALVAGQTSGLAPNCQILPIKITAKGYSNSGLLAKAICEAVDLGAKVLCTTLTLEGDTEAMQRAIQHVVDNDCLLIVAAGNRGEEYDFYPGLNHATLCAGGRTGRLDAFEIWKWSSTRAETDVYAPGHSIALVDPWDGSKEMQYMHGTSFASGFTAGAAALLWSAYPKLKASEVAELLSGAAKGGGLDLAKLVGELEAADQDEAA